MNEKFLTDENIASSLVKTLREQGYNVLDIKEEALFGISDKEIISLANRQKRIILTHDKDFANLINNPFIKHSGVILLRFSNQSPQNVIKRIIPVLKEITPKLKNSLAIVSDDCIRIIRQP